MAILFRGKGDDPSTLEEVVFESLGAASVCWEKLEKTGEFQSRTCNDIGREVIDWIEKNYEPIGIVPSDLVTPRQKGE